MGDMGEIFRDMRADAKERGERRSESYEPQLEAAGAVFKTDGVWRLGDFDCYPSKGYARNYRTNSKTSIELVLKYAGDAGKFPEPKRCKIRKL
jgi:hypothetical protein